MDESRQPVKVISISVPGVKGFNRGEILHNLRSNEKGEYSLTFNVSEGFRSTDMGLTYVKQATVQARAERH